MPRAAFSQIVNRSMSEVLTRSLITGLSTVFLIGVLLVFGGDDAQGLRLRDDGRGRLRYVLLDLHRLAGADRMEGARARLPLAAASASSRRWATCRRSRRTTSSRASTRSSATTAAEPVGEAAAPPWRRRRRPETAPATAPVAVGRPAALSARRRPTPSPEETGDGRGRAPRGRGRAHQAAAEAAERSSRAAGASTGGVADGSACLVHHRGSPSGTSPSSSPTASGAGSSAPCSAPWSGALLTGAIAQIAIGDSLGQTGIETVIFALPGTLLGLATVVLRRRSPGSRAPRGRGLALPDRQRRGSGMRASGWS